MKYKEIRNRENTVTYFIRNEISTNKSSLDMWYAELVFSETLCTERGDYLEQTVFTSQNGVKNIHSKVPAGYTVPPGLLVGLLSRLPH